MTSWLKFFRIFCILGKVGFKLDAWKTLEIELIVLFKLELYCVGSRLKYNSYCYMTQFYLLLSPYHCFISFLYLDLYVLGDDALISEGSFMQTKHLCVLIHI